MTKNKKCFHIFFISNSISQALKMFSCLNIFRFRQTLLSQKLQTNLCLQKEIRCCYPINKIQIKNIEILQK